MDADQITRQFEGGGEKALEVANKLGCAEPRLIVGLVAKGYRRWAQSSVLVKTKVGIGQKKHPITLHKCGARLVDMGGFSGPQNRHKAGKRDARYAGVKAGKARMRKRARRH